MNETKEQACVEASHKAANEATKDAIAEINKTIQMAVNAANSVTTTMQQCIEKLSQTCEQAATNAAHQATQQAHQTAKEAWQNVVNEITKACKESTESATIAATRANQAVRIVFDTVESARQVAKEAVKSAEQSVQSANHLLQLNSNLQTATQQSLNGLSVTLTDAQNLYTRANQSISNNAKSIENTIVKSMDNAKETLKKDITNELSAVMKRTIVSEIKQTESNLKTVTTQCNNELKQASREFHDAKVSVDRTLNDVKSQLRSADSTISTNAQVISSLRNHVSSLDRVTPLIPIHIF